LAYPNSDVTLLKDSQIVAMTKAGPDANFEIRLSSGVSAGVNSFSVWAKDSSGLRSIAYTFTVDIGKGSTIGVSNILLPPTIYNDKIEVRRGDTLTIQGQSAPNAEIIVFINGNGEIARNSTAGDDGVWTYEFDTRDLLYGSYTTRSVAQIENNTTISSAAIPFTVGLKNVLAPDLQSCSLRGDFNGDCRVNLVDFSIIIFWYEKTEYPVLYDLSGDGEINLTDLSIMMFYWTG